MVEEYVIPILALKPVISEKNLDLPVSSTEACIISHKFLKGTQAMAFSLFLRKRGTKILFLPFLIIPESSE